jgi:hypothetical protein
MRSSDIASPDSKPLKGPAVELSSAGEICQNRTRPLTRHFELIQDRAVDPEPLRRCRLESVREGDAQRLPGGYGAKQCVERKQHRPLLTRDT